MWDRYILKCIQNEFLSIIQECILVCCDLMRKVNSFLKFFLKMHVSFIKLIHLWFFKGQIKLFWRNLWKYSHRIKKESSWGTDWLSMNFFKIFTARLIICYWCIFYKNGTKTNFWLTQPLFKCLLVYFELKICYLVFFINIDLIIYYYLRKFVCHKKISQDFILSENKLFQFESSPYIPIE